MKIKSITLLALCVSAYLILFYGIENIGINALVLCVITLILSWIDNPYSLLPKKVQLVTVLYLLSGFAVAWHASFWSITSLYLTYGIFVAMRYEPQSSIVIACYNGIKSTKLGLVLLVSLLFKGLSKGNKLLWQRAGLVVKPLLITVLFYILYAFANPDFGFDFEWNLSFLEKINFLPWFGFVYSLVHEFDRIVRFQMGWPSSVK
jgi:hypothetical protein